MQKRETRITIESHQVMILRRSSDAVQVWCARCGDRVRMVTAEQAGIISGSTLRLVLRQVEADAVHFTETSEGRLFICLNSLIGGSTAGGGTPCNDLVVDAQLATSRGVDPEFRSTNSVLRTHNIHTKGENI